MANPPRLIMIHIGGEVFTDIIRRLGDLLAQDSHWDLLNDTDQSGSHPVLPKQRARPSRWLHIELVADPTSSITLIVRNDNMYVVGFMNHEGKVFELMGPRDRRGRPTGRSVLPPNYRVNGAYAAVCWGVKYRTILDLPNNQVVREMLSLNLNQATAMNAVRRLSTFVVGQEGNVTARRALAGLIVVLCESTRMNEHLTHFNVRWRSDQAARFTEQLMRITWNWKNMSETLLIWKENGYSYDDQCEDFLQLREDCGTRTVDDVLHMIYLVLNRPVWWDQAGGSSGASGGNWQDGSASDRGGNQMAGGSKGHGGGHQTGGTSGSGVGGTGGRHAGNRGFPKRGRPRVEVLAVRVNFRPIVGMTIAVFDGIQGQIIYSHDDDEGEEELQATEPSHDDDEGEEELQEMVPLELTGPYIGISAYGSFAVEVDIPSSTPDQDGAVWLWEWDGYNPVFSSEVDDPEPKQAVITLPQVDPPGREVKIMYRVLSNAIEANVNVKLQLLNKNGTVDSPKVHGTITAHVDRSPRTPATMEGRRDGSVLFSRPTWAKGLAFSSQDAQSFTFQPLARSVVAVPFGWTLYIDVNLHITDGNNQGVKNFRTSLDFSGGASSREWRDHDGDGDRIFADITWYPEFVRDGSPASSSSSELGRDIEKV